MSKEMKTVNTVITNTSGQVVHSGTVEVPVGWSDLAATILASKYCRPGETSATQVVDRIVGALDLSQEQSARLTEMLLGQYAAFNSPVFFNLGVKDLQGETWAWDEGIKQARKYKASERPQVSACFIRSQEDSLDDLFAGVATEASLFRFGSGVGCNFSKVRGEGEPISGGGTSSGLMSFLEVFDRAAGATKSGGTTRRAAKMVCLNDDHIDLMKFISWKSNEEKKAKALIAAGYDSDFNGEAYRTVSGQNSNNSIMVSDSLMRAAQQNEKWLLKGVKGAKKEVEATDVLDAIAQACWECGDPGVQFVDTINRARTVRPQIKASNPCAEFVFIDDSACNLASLNLVKYWSSETEEFDLQQFCSDVRLLIRCMDKLVDIGGYPTAKIAENSYHYRPLGLGYCNLGALLMRMGAAYDSDSGREIAAAITALMHTEALYMSSVLGNNDLVSLDEVAIVAHISKHLNNNKGIIANNLFSHARARARSISESPKNAQVTVLAPTGTIGLLMDCDTTGVEPMFSLVTHKKLAGGGTVKIANASVDAGMLALGYTADERAAAEKLIAETGSLAGFNWVHESHASVFMGAGEIYALGHIKMMAAVQPFLSGAISKTVNVPNHTTPSEIKELIRQAWRLQLKSVAIYRDGCKQSQPLNAAVKKKEEAKVKEIQANKKENKLVMPSKRRGTTYSAIVGGQKLFLRTGETDCGELGEIFVDMNKEGATMRSLMNCFAIAVSLGLQNGVPLQTFVDHFTFTRFEPNGVVVGHDNIKMASSIIDYIFRCLGYDYLGDASLVQVPDAVDTTKKETAAVQENSQSDAPLCTQCGSVTVRNGACHRCLNCGTSLGCS